MDKKVYEVADGVDWVNGAKTPANRRVELSEAEAQYDLGLGRIRLAASAPASKTSPVKSDA